VLDKALERKSADRFPSVIAFADAVAAAVRGKGATRPLPRTEVVPERPRRWRGAVIAGSSLAVAAIGYAGWRATRPPVPAATDRPADSAATPATTVTAPPPARSSSTGSPTTKPIEAGQTGATPAAPPPTVPPNPPLSDSTVAAGPEAEGEGLPGIPTPEDFEPPRSPRARRAAFTALRLSQDRSIADSVRAEMAWLVGQHLLDLGRRTEAARSFRHSCRLQHAPRCARMLQQLEGVP
jgi:hypothetical protein